MQKFMMVAASAALAMPALAFAQPPQDGGRMFAMIDANGDGKLDKAEVTKMAQMRAERQGDPSLAAPEKVDIFFKHLDANGDGFIDKGELEAMRKARASAPPPEAPQEAPSDAN
jgi:Ca2+-binding EF-hand superfamily protein